MQPLRIKPRQIIQAACSMLPVIVQSLTMCRRVTRWTRQGANAHVLGPWGAQLTTGSPCHGRVTLIRSGLLILKPPRLYVSRFRAVGQPPPAPMLPAGNVCKIISQNSIGQGGGCSHRSIFSCVGLGGAIVNKGGLLTTSCTRLQAMA